MSLPLSPDAVSRMFMLAAMHKRHKPETEAAEEEPSESNSKIHDQGQDSPSKPSQANRSSSLAEVEKSR